MSLGLFVYISLLRKQVSSLRLPRGSLVYTFSGLLMNTQYVFVDKISIRKNISRVPRKTEKSSNKFSDPP